MFVAHQNGFDAVSVVQTPQVLDGPIQGGDLLAFYRGGREQAALGQLFPQGFGEVGHLVKGADAPVEPLEDLLGPKGRLPQLLEKGGQLLLIHGFDIGHVALLNFAKKNPSVPCRCGQRVSMPPSTAPTGPGS